MLGCINGCIVSKRGVDKRGSTSTTTSGSIGRGSGAAWTGSAAIGAGAGIAFLFGCFFFFMLIAAAPAPPPPRQRQMHDITKNHCQIIMLEPQEPLASDPELSPEPEINDLLALEPMRKESDEPDANELALLSLPDDALPAAEESHGVIVVVTVPTIPIGISVIVKVPVTVYVPPATKGVAEGTGVEGA